MAGQQLHPNGKFHQVDFERNRRRWRVVVARQRIWIVPLHVPHPGRVANAVERTAIGKSKRRIPESLVQAVDMATRPKQKICAT